MARRGLGLEKLGTLADLGLEGFGLEGLHLEGLGLEGLHLEGLGLEGLGLQLAAGGRPSTWSPPGRPRGSRQKHTLK